jgi:adenylate kinase family enzyme
MRRVLVIGSGGAGKSVVSTRLGEVLGLPVIHLDQLYWKSGWIETEKAQWAEIVRETIAREAWILDGNYSGTLAERLEACDTVVFLDLPRVVCLWRVLVRTVRHYGAARPDMPDGCPERFTIPFFVWIWTYPSRSRRKVLSLLATSRDTKNVIHLRTRREVASFLSAPHRTPEVAAHRDTRSPDRAVRGR